MAGESTDDPAVADAGRLVNRTVLVAGGGNGLGEAAVHELASHGASVVVNDRGTSVGGEATAHAGDVSDPAYAEDLVADAVAEYGRLDAVVNFAGVLRDGVSYRMDPEDWETVVGTNLGGHFCLLRAAGAYWREEAEAVDGDGLDTERSFLAVSAMAARGNAGQVNYAASKAGVLGLVRSASTELARHEVRVNALVPNGYTRMTETVPEEHRPYTREEMPPERVAPMVAYLVGDDAAGITGCTLYAGGDRVGVLSDPAVERVGVRPGGWSVEELAESFREDVADGVALSRTERYF